MASSQDIHTTTVYDVIVIGAGWSGLISAKTYLQVNPGTKLLIIDSDSTVGGTWSKERLYPNLRCEAGWGLFHFSDLPMDGEGIDSEGWIPGSAVYRYLEQFASKFDLHRRMLLSTTVQKIERESHTHLWRLAVVSGEGAHGTISGHKLIVASGLTSSAFLPPVPRKDFGGPVYHSKDLGLPTTQDVLSGPRVKRVTVYGGSKSAFEAVYYLHQVGKTVDWVVRPHGGGPSLMAPLKMLGFLHSFMVNNTRFYGVFSPNLFDTTSKWHRVFHGKAKIFLADWFVLTFWRVTTWMMAASAGYHRSSNGLKLKPHLGNESSFWSPATLGVMTCPGLWDAVHTSGTIHVHRRSVRSLERSVVELDDGSRLPSDGFVFATGWRDNHDVFPVATRFELGLPVPARAKNAAMVWSAEEARWSALRLAADQYVVEHLPLLSRSPPGYNQGGIHDDYRLYRFLVPVSDVYADRSIAYVGFLRNTGLPIVLEAQALWATAYLLGHLDVAPREQREVEAARINAWIRRRYVCGRKVPFATVDWFPYIDMLYRDLGVVSRRKRTWWAETFALYRPEEFRGVVEEWKAARYNKRDTDHGNSGRKETWLLLPFLLLLSMLVAGVVAVHATHYRWQEMARPVSISSADFVADFGASAA